MIRSFTITVLPVFSYQFQCRTRKSFPSKCVQKNFFQKNDLPTKFIKYVPKMKENTFNTMMAVNKM